MKSQKRSPRFPFISLQEAVAKLTKLEKAGCESEFSPDSALEALGFSSPHGRATKIFGALRAYGLIDRKGRPDSGDSSFFVTEPGRMILENSEKPQQRLPYLQRAALSPKMFRQIWRNLPRDLSRADLHDSMIGRGFTEVGAERASRIYVENSQFAQLADLKVEPAGLPERPGPQDDSRKPRKRKAEERGSASSSSSLSLPLSGGVARIPGGMTDAEFQLLMQTLRLWKDKLVVPGG